MAKPSWTRIADPLDADFSRSPSQPVGRYARNGGRHRPFPHALAVERIQARQYDDRGARHHHGAHFGVQRDPDAASSTGDIAASRVPDAISVPYSNVQS